MANHVAQIVVEANPSAAVTSGHRSISDASRGHTDPSLGELTAATTVGVVSQCSICNGLLGSSSLRFDSNGDFTGRCTRCQKRPEARMIEYSGTEEAGL